MSYNKLRIDVRYKGGSSHHVKLFQINERASLPFSLFLAVYIRGDIRLLLINQKGGEEQEDGRINCAQSDRW